MRHPVGGIRTHILYNYPALIDAGYCFTFVAPPSEAFRAFQEELHEWPGVEFVEIDVRGQNHHQRAPLQFAPLRRLLTSRRPCLVHSHGFNAAVATIVANFGIGVPHVFTSHGVISPGEEFPGLTGQIRRLCLNFMLYSVDKVIAVSHDAAENHRRHFPVLRSSRNERLSTIVNGIDPSRFRIEETHEDEVLRSKLGIEKDTFLVGFLGRFMHVKGFTILVEALDRMLDSKPPGKRFHLLAVGSGDFRREYQAETESRARVAPHVTFIDHLPSITLLLREIDLLVMPSLAEACGLLAMEAMMMGVPVLGSDCIGLREVLADTPSVTVPAGESKALADALHKAIENPWTKTAQNFVPDARSRFDVKHAARQLQSLFDELSDAPGNT